ncbi:MAG: hypothetical protein AAFX93_07385 [Verrucomicrobiota bacterium]
MRLLLVPLFACFAIATIGCRNDSQSPPPATELIGGPCQYSEKTAIAVVSDADQEQVRFLINESVVPYSREDLPSDYDYSPGKRFRVTEKRITEGTCTPYILTVDGPTDALAPEPRKRAKGWKFPEPTWKY